MIKKWVTVVSWQKGEALLRCDREVTCHGCVMQSQCNVNILNTLPSAREDYVNIAYEHPLESGQRVEIGVMEGDLLLSAVLVYLVPLLGLILGGSLQQWWFGSDLLTLLGSAVGGCGTFFVATRWANHLSKKRITSPVILKVTPPPPTISS